MMSLAVPLVLLYDISILSVVMIERGRAREDAARAASGSSVTAA
jgi:Sec-independent protein secretion pathway component TatC